MPHGAQDHFSPIAKQYQEGRPGYPSALYDYLHAQCLAHDLVWDCATGGGQAAADLIRYFSRVVATDVSAALLARAPKHPLIEYKKRSAENSGLAGASADLITVAQAIHWFDLPAFWDEAGRVLKPGGVLAFWGYTWPEVNPTVDEVLDDLKREISAYWPGRIAPLHHGYSTITSPFPTLPSPPLRNTVHWSAAGYLAHLRSWSAIRYCNEAKGRDIMEAWASRFHRAWGPLARLRVSWPLHLQASRKP